LRNIVSAASKPLPKHINHLSDKVPAVLGRNFLIQSRMDDMFYEYISFAELEWNLIPKDHTFIEYVFYEKPIHPVRLRLPPSNEKPPRPSDTPPMDGMKFSSV